MSKKVTTPAGLATLSFGNTRKLEVSPDLKSLNLSKQSLEDITGIIRQSKHPKQVDKELDIPSVQRKLVSMPVLFTGENSSGKLSAAGYIANNLNLKLYRIDLAQVVNKYIGETEKNLKRIFDAAEESGAILFFDEADALFGKRSEVKDSHDRYANIEVSYLLQRMESYHGIAILATNIKSAPDVAFIGRFQSIIHFPMPKRKERKNIWQIFRFFHKKKTFITVAEINGSGLQQLKD